MMGKTHFAIGLTLCVALAYPLEGETAFKAGVIATGTLGALVPDLDSPVSTLGSLLLVNPFRLLTSHRGILHSGFALIVLGLAYVVTHDVLLGFFFAGYASHLFLDSLTIKGIPLVMPRSKFHILPISFMTGGLVDYLLFLAAWLVLIGIFASGGDLRTILSIIQLHS